MAENFGSPPCFYICKQSMTNFNKLLTFLLKFAQKSV
ncbi:MAG: DUF2492 family protein [Aeriscardovia sp.]|nr:DUF2492 family protein [Aeriscardovia sp.]MBR3461447.1 DUF2492 family protein [Clostridiales bacterium]